MTNRAYPMYIWQQPDWPHFRYDRAALDPLLVAIRRLQGRLIGHAEHLGAESARANQPDALIQEAIETFPGPVHRPTS